VRRPSKGDLVDLNKLTLSDKILGGTGIVLLIDLFFLPWHHIKQLEGLKELGEAFGVSTPDADISAVQDVQTLWAWLAVLLTLAVLAALIITRFTSTKLPELPVPLNQAIFYASIAVFALLVLKLIVETSSLGYGSYLGIVLAGGMAYGGFLKSKETAEASGTA
jgi:hypothetical protein